MSNVARITGEKFGRLRVISRNGSNKRGLARWMCECDCGRTLTVDGSALRNGNTTSCGCSMEKSNGEAKSRTTEYSCWESMISRCENKNNKYWHNYGGRGITIDQRWRRNFLEFLKDVGRRPGKEYSLDRINNDGNYEPGNVRWATRKQQGQNRRQRKTYLNWRFSANHAYRVVNDFEDVLASYTGAPFVVAVDSCTAALHLVCTYLRVKEVEIPKKTYVGVAASIKNSGGNVRFRDEEWCGSYKLEPYPIIDSARRFTSGMYVPGTFMCLSFHWTKHLCIGRGGAILFDDKNALEWLQRAAFDGRERGTSPKSDKGLILGFHYYLTPVLAAQGLMLMAGIKEHNDDLPNSDYPDLSSFEVFK